LFTSLRNQDIFNEENTGFKQDIILDEEQVYEALNGELVDKKSYIKTVNEVINKGVAHYWHDDGISKYNLRLPFHENYLLFSASYIMPKIFLKYELMDYRRALERGVGLCSQHAIIVADVLKEKGIHAKMIGLSGHVVATAEVDDKNNEWWVIDADYGVIIPHSLGEIEKRPDIVAPYYREHGYVESTITTLVGIYGKEGNVLVSGNGSKNYSPLKYGVEKAAYVLIWIIPVLFILPIFIFQHRHRKTTA
jgi:hypothetical protein